MVSSTHNVCAKDIHVAIVSTIVETDRPELEIAPGLNLLGPIYDKSVFFLFVLYFLMTILITKIDLCPLHLCTVQQAQVKQTIFSSLDPMMRHPISRQSLRTFKTFGSE